jgi:hypothetical protein
MLHYTLGSHSVYAALVFKHHHVSEGPQFETHTDGSTEQGSSVGDGSDMHSGGACFELRQGHRLCSVRIIVVVLSVTGRVPGYYFEIGQDHFLSSLRIHHSSTIGVIHSELLMPFLRKAHIYRSDRKRRPSPLYRNKLTLYCEELLAPVRTSQAGRPPLVGCPRLLNQCIHSYPPYLEGVSSIRNLRTRHAVVTRDQLNAYLYPSQSTIRMIKSSTMRWTVHVARIGNKRNSYRILLEK